jgi:uncharacterized protein YbjT (DUF2867 family)
VKVYVLISSANPNASARSAYSRIKGELEDAVEELGFEWTVFVRLGLILGAREDSRPSTATMRSVYSYFLRRRFQ